MGVKYKRQNGETMEAFNARCRQAQTSESMARCRVSFKIGKRKRRIYSEHDRVADRIDGYDRDDLGESPDY